MGFVCSVCGEYHDELMLDIRMGLPEAVFELSTKNASRRAEVAEDRGIFRYTGGGEHYYVRGLLEIPIPSLDRCFGYGAWIEVAARATTGSATCGPTERGRGAAFRGPFANELAPYEGTLGLPVMLSSARSATSRELVETDHPLRGEQQRRRITEERAREPSCPRTSRRAPAGSTGRSRDSQSLHEPAYSFASERPARSKASSGTQTVTPEPQ